MKKKKWKKPLLVKIVVDKNATEGVLAGCKMVAGSGPGGCANCTTPFGTSCSTFSTS